jgi:hypothetical protein
MGQLAESCECGNDIRLKISALLDVTPCSQIGSKSLLVPNDGEIFRNVDIYLPDYTVSHPRTS